ncbi:hypothetical protein Pcinc_021680 [Petrolisthes cinctipes]|uniref:Uncharacterized protein n=1 Tax=Petrolisthes cinctipes TaxID=88211 RepID=A0AAE1KJH0_PETCI|nr:hypothetical protein Pcinc_021680 [Petrolisthes cinctipes]
MCCLAVRGCGVRGRGVRGCGVRGRGVRGRGVSGRGVRGWGVRGRGVRGRGVRGWGVRGWGVRGRGVLKVLLNVSERNVREWRDRVTILSSCQPVKWCRGSLRLARGRGENMPMCKPALETRQKGRENTALLILSVDGAAKGHITGRDGHFIEGKGSQRV